MAKKKPLSLSLVLLFFLQAFAQSPSGITGRVTDKNNKALSFVSVVLLKDSTAVSGTTTDEQGNFLLAYAPANGQTYSVKLSLIGYKTTELKFVYPDTGLLQSVVLDEDKQVLGVVTVAAKRPLIVRKTDRYIVNVENSLLSTGNSGLEVLQKSPGIWIDNNGSIKVKGNQSVMVMINDVVQRMSEEELSDYLKTLKSEDISRIEVIMNPPAEFEAAGAGGIIHIILKKARKDGFNGSANVQYRQQGSKPYVTSGASMDYKVKDLYLFGGYTFTKDKKDIIETSDIRYPDASRYYNYTNRNDDITRNQYRLGIGYDLARNHSIGLQTVGTTSRLDQLFNTDVSFKSTGQTVTGIAGTHKLRDITTRSTTLNYLWKMDSLGSMLKFISDYARNKKDETNYFLVDSNDPQQRSENRNSLPNETKIFSAQADYTKVLRDKMEIRGGVKYASIERDNTLVNEYRLGNDWIEDAAGRNRFIYEENLVMLYSSIERSIKKTSIKAGLRAEQTYSKGNSVSSGQRFTREYFGLFPSVFVMRTLNEEKGNAVYLNYTKRLQRPSLSELNPQRLQFSNYTAQTGNPGLRPQYTHSIAGGYKFSDEHSVEAYVARTTDVIALLSKPGNNNFIEYQTQNLSNSKEVGLNASSAFTILKGWSANNNFSFFNFSYQVEGKNMNQTSFALRSAHTITLKNIADIEAIADYRSPYVYSNMKYPYMFYFDLGFSKRILKNKGRVRLYFSDIFNTLREKEITDYNNTHIEFYRKRPTRTAGLTFTYNFSSGKKFSNRRIDQSNTEERNRIGN